MCKSEFFYVKSSVPPKFPRPVLSLSDFPVSEKTARSPPVLVMRFEQTQHGCGNVILCAVTYGILFAVLKWPSSEIKGQKKKRRGNPLGSTE